MSSKPSLAATQIKLQFVCGHDVASRAIAWWGNGYGGFSHVDAVMPTLPKATLLGARSDAVGDEPPGVQIRAWGYEPYIRHAIVAIDVTQPVFNLWQQFLYAQVRDKAQYDPQAIWGFFMGKPWHENGHWICSALQKGALRKCGRLYQSQVPDSQTTPDGLFDIVTSALGGKVVEGGFNVNG